MANEFKIKAGLLINNTHPVTGITDSSAFSSTDTSTLATVRAIKEYVDSSLNNYLLKEGGIITGPLIIDSSLIVTGDVSISGDLIVDGAIISTSVSEGISTIEAGLIVNNSGEGGNINDFIVNTDNYVAIDVSARNDAITIMNNTLGKIGFFGVSPTTQSTGWDVSTNTVDKILISSNTTLNELANVLATLIIELKSKGLLG